MALWIIQWDIQCWLLDKNACDVLCASLRALQDCAIVIAFLACWRWQRVFVRFIKFQLIELQRPSLKKILIIIYSIFIFKLELWGSELWIMTLFQMQISKELMYFYVFSTSFHDNKRSSLDYLQHYITFKRLHQIE